MKITNEGSDLFEAKEKPFVQILIGLISLGVGLNFALNVFPIQKVPIEVAIFLILFGLIFIISSSFVTLTANKSSQKIRLATRSVIKNEVLEFQFSQVKLIEVVQSMVSSQKGGSKIVYNLYLNKSDGKSVLLASSGGSSVLQFASFIAKSPMSDIGKKLADFMGVPFEEKGLPSFGQITDMISEAISKQSKNQEKAV